MVTLQRILLTTDFSDNARNAYPCAASLARKFGAALSSVHFAYFGSFVFETHPDRIGLYEKMWKATAGRPETTEQRFAELKQSELAGIEVELESCQGIPAVEIVHRARDADADLMIIGTHGTLGSVAQNVTREAHCPVLIASRKNHDKHND